MFKKENVIILSILIIIVIALVIIYMNKGISKDYDFKVYFFNAGKADAILISKKDTYVLIDTGEESLSDDILKYLDNNNINKIDYLIITHFDKDHVGSAASIIDNIEVGEVLQSNYPKESEYYTNYLNSIANKSITPITVSGSYSLAIDNLTVVVNGPEIVYESSESNNSSLIVSIINGSNKFLFMGDAENARIKEFISNTNETYDFIKLPYHGNYLKNLDELLDLVKPTYGVMTCSTKEGCEEDTIELLKKSNINYYMTKDGSISIYSDGKNIVIKQ